MSNTRFRKAIFRLMCILKWYFSNRSTWRFKQKLDQHFHKNTDYCYDYVSSSDSDI